LKPQALPSQVASAFSGGAQGMQPVPQLLRSVSATQLPLQSCLPAGHWPLHACAVGTQAPAQIFVPSGHWLPHFVPSQVALPPLGTSHGVQAVPQLPTSPLLRHESPHLW
jgi:hypothetical protein